MVDTDSEETSKNYEYASLTNINMLSYNTKRIIVLKAHKYKKIIILKTYSPSSLLNTRGSNMTFRCFCLHICVINETAQATHLIGKTTTARDHCN